MPDTLPADVIVTWLGAAGVIAYILHIHGQRTRSLLERRALFLLYALGLLFLLRGFYWLSGYRGLGVLVFIPATLLPLAITLFIEGLLRRHLRLAFKIYVSAGTALFMTMNLLAVLPFSRPWLAAFGLFVISVLLYLSVVLFSRDPGDLSEAENRFANVVSVGLAVALPLVATDFRAGMWSWAPLKLGSIGGLIFVYTCVRASNRFDRKGIVFGEFVTILLIAVLVAAMFLAVGQGLRSFDPAYLAVAACLTLLFMILWQLRALRMQHAGTSLLRALLDADVSAPDRFLASLRELPLLEERFLLRREDLQAYDEAAIVRKLEEQGGLCRLSALRESLARGEGSMDAAEQLVDLLERYGTSHVCLVQHSPAMLLLVSLPQVAGAHLTELELAVVGRCARLTDGRRS